MGLQQRSKINYHIYEKISYSITSSPLALAIRRAACVASHTAHADACLSVVQACLSVVQACLSVSVVQACLSAVSLGEIDCVGGLRNATVVQACLSVSVVQACLSAVSLGEIYCVGGSTQQYAAVAFVWLPSVVARWVRLLQLIRRVYCILYIFSLLTFQSSSSSAVLFLMALVNKQRTSGYRAKFIVHSMTSGALRMCEKWRGREVIVRTKK